jgi:acetylornithine deacetylase/succinyl-diaminopimelate desuccinylase-like protein
MSEARSAAVEYAREHREATLDLLKEFVRIPSVSLEPGHRHDVRIAADWLAERLRALKHDRVEVFPTGGHPVVYGELMTAGPSAPTVLIYGHYDVQPAAPLDAWKTDPFELSARGSNLHGRGVSDMKGQVVACLAAVEAAISTGSLPVNIKFLIEGEEELGSTHFGDFLTAHKDMLSGDLILVTDVGMLGPDSPTVFYGLRGMYMGKLRVSGPATDLHSGEYGGVVYNPIHALSKLIAGLHEDGRVALPGFYDRVRPITPEEHSELASLPLDEKDYLEQSGVTQLWGESDYIPVERAGARPALDVIQFRAGSPKSAIPAEAEALITARLVPDQIPDEVHAQLLCYLEANTPPEVLSEIVEWTGFRASITDRDTPGIQALSWAFETVWGKKPVFYRSGGSIAAVGFMREILGIDSVLTGFSLPDDHVHGANEKMHRPTWERGTDALVHFLFNLRL